MIFYITTKYYHERSTILARVQWSEGIKTMETWNWNSGPHYVMTHERKLEVIYMMLLLIAYFHTVNATWIEAIRGVISDSKIF